MSQHQVMSIAERDETYQTNARLAIHCHRQGAIDKVELNQILEWQQQSALRRRRAAESRMRNRGLASVGQAMRGGRP